MKPDTKDGISFTPQQYEWLRQAFPALEVTPKTPLADVMYNAGEQNVLRRIRMRVKGWVEREVT